MWRRLFLFGSLAVASLCEATDLKPWFPRYLEFQSRFTYLHQQYHEIDTKVGCISRGANNDFYTGSLQLSYDVYCAELETTFSATRRHHLGPDNIKATFRYQILDDVIGDPVSLVAGISLSQVFALALKDVSVFHHGQLEGEVNLALGSECPTWTSWLTRWWTVLALGTGDHGSPWVRGELAWERNWVDKHRFRLFTEMLFGLGGQRLRLFVPFKGYGPVHHQSIDFGLLYRYSLPCDGALSVGYSRRLFGKNCPVNVNFYFVQLLYPFGI